MSITTEKLLATLKFHFSYSQFRNHQEEAIRATLDGRDLLLILPTGGGKSMTFQLPALARGNCFTVVVGPLMALAKDQVDHCLDLGIDARVWNSETSDEARRQIMSELVTDEPEMRLLYTTPESLRNPSLRSYLKEAYDSGTLLSFAIDEAHCVSEWGHDFRAAYLELSTLKSDFSNTPIAALTASCTSTVERSIVNQLRMKNPVIIKGGFNRPNIHYQIVYKELVGGGTQDEILEHLAAFIKAREGQCGIIYARLRATCDWLCSALSSCDIDLGVYHAGKDGQRRRQVQRDWCEGGTDIVVATIAFGMGIDRADVRWVVHWDVPSSLEGFYQESGRAGRDGLPCESVVYVGADDLDSIARLEKSNRQGAVAAVTAFCCQPGCRRRKLLDYFGQKRGACDITQGEQQCDYCRDPRATSRCMTDWEEQVQRRSVQLALKQQREAMGFTADDDAEQQQLQQGSPGTGCANSDQNGSAAGHPVKQQQKQQNPAKLRPGMWGSAKALDGAARGQQQPPGLRPRLVARGSNSSSSSSTTAVSLAGVLRDASNSPKQPAQTANGSEAAATAVGCAAGASTPASVTEGVKLPQGPVAVPQLRKRLARQPFGVFKAPRMMQNNSSVAANRDICKNHQLEQHQQQPQHASSGVEPAPLDKASMQQTEEQAVMTALGADATAAITAGQLAASASKTAGSSSALCSKPVMGRRAGGAPGRVFVPSLKRG